MRIEWKPVDYNPEAKRSFLVPLFQAGLKSKSSPDALCKIVRDISTVIGHDAHANVAMYDAILKNAPDCADAWCGLAQNLRRIGKLDEALVAAKAGLKIDPERPDLLTTAGNIYFQLQDNEAAVACFQNASEKAPKLSVSNLSKTLLRMGKPEECKRILNQHVDRYGPSTDSLALSIELHMHEGSQDAVDQVLDFDRIQRSDQNDVYGGEVLADMNGKIVKAVTYHPAMVFEPGSTATVKGKQTFLQQVLDEELIKFVVGMIQKQVEIYIKNMPETAIMPARPERLGITTWVVMLEEAGFQQPHFHPGGWLSGVYYVSAPDDGNDPDAPGAIEFGCLPHGASPKVPAKPHLIQPVTGQMLLFPSYFHHRTIPKKSATPRICISFDIN